MNDTVREAGHDLNNQLSAILALADLERKRAMGNVPLATAFSTICDSVRRAAASATVLAAFGRDRKYLRRLTTDTDALLLELEERCARDGIPAVEPDTGRFLGVMVSCMLAGSILELGTAYGYSTLWMARAQPETGRIWTIDPNHESAAVARSYFERSGFADRIEIIEQPALDILPKLPQRQYDIVFIDALKEEYPEYLRLALPHLKRSGLVIVDNLLWHHQAAGAPLETDDVATKAIRRFNKIFLSHPDLNATILPVGDGVGVGAKVR
jgi:predicted O-methyltransferase YrrM